jgi:hypothetical protein
MGPGEMFPFGNIVVEDWSHAAAGVFFVGWKDHGSVDALGAACPYRAMCNLYYADPWIMPTIGSERARAAAIAASESA